jgi:SET domain
MVALRAFQKNDVIVVERPILKVNGGTPRIDQIEATARPAALALAPLNVEFLSKFRTNVMECSSSMSGLFLTISRINHDCFGNSDHFYFEHRGVQVLVARNSIASGEEVTFSYVDPLKNDKYQYRRWILPHVYGFTCRCCVCLDPDLEADMYTMKELKDEVLHYGTRGMIDAALEKGKALVTLFDKRGMSSWDYYCAYYDLYQLTITRRQNLAEGIEYIRQAYESVLACTHDEAHDRVIKMKKYADAPTSHENYGSCD